jgi:hypothetical protein
MKDFLDGCKRLQRLQKLSALTDSAGALKLVYFWHQFRGAVVYGKLDPPLIVESEDQ